jgi:myo-inositol-1(or 4)-monophosphatase
MDAMELEDIARIALQAADRGGRELRRCFGNLSRIDKKGAIDLVTEADLASEKAILETIRAHCPGHSILAEESGWAAGSRSGTWIIDPLDGTTNFAHNLPVFAVSIAFADRGELRCGVVFNPMRGELFRAVLGAGATLNGRPIRVSTTARLKDALLMTGFPYDMETMMDTVLARLGACLSAVQGVRRPGAASLDLCDVACGRCDGFWEEHLKPWDTAAGVLIVKEAGGRVTDFAQTPFVPEMPSVLATNGAIHASLADLLETVGG